MIDSKHQGFLKSAFSNFLILIFTSLLLSCGGSSSNEPVTLPPVQPAIYTYSPPLSLNDGWTTTNANDLNIDSSVLELVVQNIIDERQDFRFIDAIAVIKNGQLVLDERFKSNLDFTDDWSGNQNVDLHILNSATKSYASTLIGIAIDQQLISGVDVKVHDFFDHKFPIANWTDEKSNISLKNWLTMQHGYQWDEWNVSYFDASNLNAQMNNSVDPIQFLLDRPMLTTPGSTFAYSTGVSYGLGRIVQNVSGQRLRDYMEQYLFEPLQISNYDFFALDGQIHTGSALYLSNRDMAKLGQLFLNDGSWNGNQIIAESWIAEATTRYVDNVDWGYGYQWWIRNFTVNGQTLKCYYADGLGGQYVFVFPEIDAIISFQGDAYEDSERDQRNVTRIIEEFLLPQLL